MRAASNADLIAKRPVCVYGLLDEGCASGSGTDSAVLSNYNGVFKDPKKHKAYIRPKKSADKSFIIAHYAGEVCYEITGFVEDVRQKKPQKVFASVRGLPSRWASAMRGREGNDM